MKSKRPFIGLQGPKSRRLASLAGAALVVFTASLLPAQPATSSGSGAFHPVDLSSFVTCRLTGLPANDPWQTIPMGMQTFGEVPFQVSGLVEVTGLEAAREGDFDPPRISGIPVRRRASRLHLLLGAIGGEDDGVPLAALVLHYADGQTRTVRLGYGVHLRNTFTPRYERSSELADSRSRVAWTSEADSSDRSSRPMRLFAVALENPRPGEELRQLDFVSLFSRATPFLLGLTVDEASAGQIPQPSTRRLVRKLHDWSDAVYRRAFSVRVTDAAEGRPLTNASVHLTISDDRESFYFGSATANVEGRLALDYPPQHTVAFRLWVQAPNRIPVILHGSRTNSPAGLQDEFAVKLERGVEIGGVVKSTAGQAIAGAEVVIGQVTSEGPRRFVQMDYDRAVTDAQGQWASTAVPADFSDLQFEVHHPDFRPARFVQGATGNAAPKSGLAQFLAESLMDFRRPMRAVLSVSKQDLLAAKAEMILEPAIRFVGVVADEAGQPVPQASMFLLFRSESSEPRATFKSDAQGRFSCTLADAREFGLAVLAPGFSPRYQAFSLAAAERPAQIVLQKTRPASGRVQDQGGAPIADALVRVDSWQNTRLLHWQVRTDAEGRFTWDNPPQDQVTVSVSAPNASTVRQSRSGGFAGEWTIVLHRPLTAVGTVVDGETRQLIERFTVTHGFQQQLQSSPRIHWLRYNIGRGRKGEYSLRLNDYGSVSNWIMIEAKGYVPVKAGPFSSRGWVTNNIELRKGRGLGGVVQMAAGEPVPNCTLVLAAEGESPNMSREGQLRSDSRRDDQVRSDRAGRFEFPPRLDPVRVFAAHPRGYAEVSVEDLQKSGRIVLAPWGRVTGRFRVGPTHWAGRAVVLLSAGESGGQDSGGPPELGLYLRGETGADGAFAFDQVPPGWRQAAVEYRVERGDETSMAHSHGIPVEVKPGESSSVTLGGTGRTVVGRVVSNDGLPVDSVDWPRDFHSLTLRLPAPRVPGPAFTPGLTELDQQRVMAEFERRNREYWQSAEGRALSRQRRRYVLLFETNGTFRIENVLPGAYDLHVNLRARVEQDGSISYQHLGGLHREVIVPEAPAGRPAEAFDLGPLSMPIQRPQRLPRLSQPPVR